MTVQDASTPTQRFEALFRAHERAVRSYALRRATPEQAQDAVAETFLVAWRRIDDVPVDARPWLLGVMRKVLANQRRSDGRAVALTEQLARAAPGTDGDPAELVGEAEVMRAAFASLSEGDREVLLMVAAAGAPPAELKPGTFAVRLHRARARLAARARSLATLPVLLIALAAVAALLVTPPGRAGLSWALELIGVGEVGGPPTQRDRAPLRPTTGPFVVDNGRAPDGSRYEWVAHRGGLPSFTVRNTNPRRRGGPGPVTRIPADAGLCLVFEWPRRPWRRGTGGCWSRPEPHAPASLQSTGPLQSLTWWPIRRRARSEVVVVGTTDGSVRRVALRYRDGAELRALPVDFARVEGPLLQRLGLPRGLPGPFGVFTAFVPVRLAERDRLRERFPAGTLLVDRRLRSADRRANACMRRRLGGPPAAPFELAAYDADGHRVAFKRTLAGWALPRACRPSQDRIARR